MKLTVLREQIRAVSLEGLSPVTFTKRISRETMILVLCGNLQEKATLNTEHRSTEAKNGRPAVNRRIRKRKRRELSKGLQISRV